MELISLIKEELLKSAELTGLWEKKLRQIEHHEYSAAQFIDELKIMVSDIVRQVLSDNSNRHVTQTVSTEATEATGKAKTEVASTTNDKPVKAKPKRRIIREGSLCPECGQGKVIKGKTAYGCSRWKEGCNWRKPFKK